MNTLHITTPNDLEIVHTRTFAASPASVFAALTDPRLLPRWYGPPGWTVITAEGEPRPGGRWRIVTRQPSGREISQQGVYVEVDAPHRFVKTERWLDWDVGEVRITTQLAPHVEGTTITVTTRFPSKEVRDQLVASGAGRDAAAHYDKLETFLARDAEHTTSANP